MSQLYTHVTWISGTLQVALYFTTNVMHDEFT